MNMFTQGQELKGRSICDSECVFTATVEKRTDKTVTLNTGKRCKIYNDADGSEYIFPYGKYSMAPIFRA